MRSEKLYRFGMVVGSALLVSIGFPPADFSPVILIGLVPLLWLLFDSTPKQAWRSGYLFGLIFGAGQLHWVYQLAATWTQSTFMGLIPWALATMAMAVYFGLIGYLIQKCVTRGWFWAIPLVWAGVEVFRSYIPVLAFPWGLLAMPLSRYPAIIQPAHFGTMYLLSAWVVAVNLGLVLAAKRTKLPKASLALVVTIFALPVISVGMWLAPRSTAPTKVTLGQPGVNLAFGNPKTMDRDVEERVKLFDRQAKADGSRLLVLPEGAAHSLGGWRFFSFPLDPDVPILFGAQRRGMGDLVYQSAVGFDGRWHAVDKTRLVLFGEFVPGRGIIPFLDAFHLPSGDLSAGEHGTLAMGLGGLKLGPLICFEGMFPDLGFRQAWNGALILPLMSDDDWFMNSSCPDQLKDSAIWRAVETGLPVVRVGSLGYSLACDGKGNIVTALPLGASKAVTVDIPTPTSSPFLYESVLFPAASFALCLGLFLPYKRKKLTQTTP